MSDWVVGFIAGCAVGIPLWGSFGALVIVLVMSSKHTDEEQ